MALKSFVLLSFVATALADRPSFGYSPPAPAPPPPAYSAPAPPPRPTYGAPEPQAPAKYDFDWAVKDDYSGNDFGHQESRDGDYTQGSYYVLLPDGRTQRVTYSVNGDSGFVAEVTYEGEARATYSAPSRPQPTYSAPPTPQPTYAPAPPPVYAPSPPAYNPPPPSPPQQTYGTPSFGRK